MSIYITQQQKEEWELKINSLQLAVKTSETAQDYIRAGLEHAELKIYQELLSKTIVLPVEESWEDTLSNTEVTDCIYSNKMNYPNGVIIK
jgi:hypothetical protein